MTRSNLVNSILLALAIGVVLGTFLALPVTAAAPTPSPTPTPDPSPTPTPTPTPPPLTIPFAINISQANGTPDMGATPDVNLVWNVSIQSRAYSANGCTSPCHLNKYIDLISNKCNTDAVKAAATWANTNDEKAFAHVYGGPQTSGNRMFNLNGRSNPCGSHPVFMNLGDSGFETWLYANVWTNTGSTYFPQKSGQPLGFYEDNGGVVGQYWTGLGGNDAGYPSGEYSVGSDAGITNPVNYIGAAGTHYDGGTTTFSSYVSAIDYQTALATFVNNACRATCLSAMINGAAELARSSGKLACNVVVPPNCHDKFATGFINNHYDYSTLIAAVISGGGVLLGLETEKPIMGQCVGNLSGCTMPPTYASPAQLIGMLNTLPAFYAEVDCTKTKLTDYEYGFGTGGPGVPADFSQIQHRTLALAMHWLIPNPTTQLPDCWIPRYLTLNTQPHNFDDGGRNESPSFFEFTLVAWQPEQSVAPFTWNGTTQTVGGGADSTTANACGTHGDTHGSIDILVACVNSGGARNDGAGIYCQQYEHMLINGVDKGKVAACVDTSASANPAVASSWFKHDPWTSYNYTLTLTIGELTSIPYQAAAGGTISFPTCIDANCVAYPSAGAEATAWSSGSPGTICAASGPPCGIIFMANPVP